MSGNLCDSEEPGNTDFGLDFGNAFLAPVRSSRSRSKTPARQSREPRQTSQSAVRRSREPSFPHSRRSTSTTAALQQSAAKASVDDRDGDPDTLRSAKRRKTVDDRSLSQPPNLASAQAMDIASPERARTLREARQSLLDGTNAPEGDDESFSRTKNPTKRRKRKSIGQQSLFKKKRSSTAVTQTADAASAERGSLRGDSTHGDEVEGAFPDGSMNNDQTEDPELVEDQQEPEVSEPEELDGKDLTRKGPRPLKKRRKKRRSIGQQATRRKSQKSTKAVNHDHSSAEDDEATPSIEHPTVPEQPSSDGEDRARRRPPSTTSAPPVRASPIGTLVMEDSSGDEDYEDEDDTPDPAPEASRSKKSKGNKPTQSRPDSSLDTRQRPARVKASFPIITQRLAGFDTLPTIDEHGESEPDSEQEQAREAELRATLDRPHPNAVDVLGQYCRETVQAAVDRLDEGPANNRDERKRKQAALEAVGQELDDQLVDMSAAVEHRIQLSRRTRKAKRNKAELQARWLETRRQREEVALKCDEIRQQNWQREQDREQKWAVSEAAHKLTLEVERADPEEEQQDDLEFLLRTLADDVSDRSGAGLLDRIKSFNGQLEQMAGVLEGRGVQRPQ